MYESRELGVICDENGVVIADEERVMNRWKEYFEGIQVWMIRGRKNEIDNMWGQGWRRNEWAWMDE